MMEDEDFDDDLDNVFMMERQLYNVPINVVEEMGTSTGDYSKSPMKRLLQFCKTVLDEMTNVDILRLSQQKTAFFMERVNERVAHPEYMNPTALVLGFWLVDNTRASIDETRFKNILAKINLLQFPVKGHDVIRYARLWQQFLLAH